jgi:hypothetical protein
MTTSATNRQAMIKWPCDARPTPLKSRIEMDTITGDVAGITRRRLLAAKDHYLGAPSLHRVAGQLVLVLVVAKTLRGVTIDGRAISNCTSLCWRDTCRRLVGYRSGTNVARALVAAEGMLIRVAGGAYAVVGEQLYEISIDYHRALLLQRRQRQTPGSAK